ncbi:hypothetical protein [Ferrimonas sp. SCSIO 43195]|uniref:hypothetical protein n=1 Tax=Ferrimonas sp. SCSIO 43195 TaxID=2822844 RepID=UPI002075437D|nr:hypothetical protein [Ferrimonas sp. SCSIO 43195]USD35945.1 hypothetical protein J8Z22_12920 [Ferrimonas sp. SCSIO 43195]
MNTHAMVMALALLISSAHLHAQDTVVIDGAVTDRHGKAVPLCDVIFNPSGFIADDSLYFKCDANGRYRAEIPAGHYNSLYSLDLPQYAKTQLEFWGWNLQLTENQTIDIAFDTIEVYSLAVWASNGGSQSLFAAFRPMHLAAAKLPRLYYKNVDGTPKAIMDISPTLTKSDIQASIDGEPVVLIDFHWSYEHAGQCSAGKDSPFSENEPCYMPMIIAQFHKPKLAPGKHLLRVRIQDHLSKEIGEGVTHFSSNSMGLGF